jgi:divalent metal cation (Fe/Co/Zn/Cd) transporter
MTASVVPTREQAVRRGQWLTAATIAYNSLEALISIGAGVLAGSVALVGFGVDSVIEVSSSVAGLWRLHADASPSRRARTERHALRFIGICFLVLAAYVLFDATRTLLSREQPAESIVGIVVAVGSLIVMPLLARAKRRVAAQLTSSALTAEARQTEICMYLSAILLVGLLLNAVFGWWWAAPVAGVARVPLIGYEGFQAVRGRTVCADGCH